MESKKIKIEDEYIKLDSFLKLVGATVTGGEAKLLIQNGQVQVNLETCYLRGKKLRKGYLIKAKDVYYEVV